MGIVDAIIQPSYFIKSCIKLMLFIGLPILYSFIFHTKEIQSVFVFNAKGIKVAFLLGSIIFILITSGYFILRNVIDFSNITNSLSNTIGVDKDNFILVSLYISFVNSFLEEFFFRGFGFLILSKYVNHTFAFTFSSLMFALYHIAMMIGWFAWYIVLLAIIGLAIGGCIFNYCNKVYKNIYISWFIHLFANIGINTVGCILFGII